MIFVYITTLFFAFTLSIVPAAAYLLDPIFGLTGVGAGFKTPLVDVLILLGMTAIAINSPNKVMKEFIAIFKWWIPWIVYLLIRSDLEGVGLWKFQMYIARVLIPTAAIALIYLAAPDKFERYFFGLLFALAVVLVPTLLLYDSAGNSDGGYFFSNIWLSRMLAILALYLFIKIKLQLDLVAKISLISVCVFTMFLIGSRGPFLSLLLTATAYFMLINRKNFRVMFGGGVVAILVAVIFLQFLNVSSMVASFLTRGESDKIENIQAADNRTGAYEPTLKIVADKPVLGVGLGLWSKTFYKENGLYDDGEYKYPHNFILEILSELGIVGLAFFLLLFRPFIRLFSLNNKYNIFILLGLLFAATSSDLTQNAAPIIFSMLSLIYVKINSNKTKMIKDIPVTPLKGSTSKHKILSVRLR